MKISQLLENDNRAGFIKGKPLSDEIRDPFIIIFRAQPTKYTDFTKGSYVTRSKKFAKDHAISSANYEDEQFHVVQAFVKTKDVFNASNPGEYIYDGEPARGRSIFTANPGDDFE